MAATSIDRQQKKYNQPESFVATSKKGKPIDVCCLGKEIFESEASTNQSQFCQHRRPDITKKIKYYPVTFDNEIFLNTFYRRIGQPFSGVTVNLKRYDVTKKLKKAGKTRKSMKTQTLSSLKKKHILIVLIVQLTWNAYNCISKTTNSRRLVLTENEVTIIVFNRWSLPELESGK